MTRTLNGMHLSNAGQYDLEQMCRIASGAVTLMHFQMFPQDTMSDNTGDHENEYLFGKLRYGWGPQGIAPSDRLIHIRLYQSKWTDWDPKEIARRAVALLSNWRSAGRDGHPVLTADLLMDPLVLLSPVNEQNLEGDWEPGGWWGMTEDERAGVLQREAQWQLDFWAEMDRLRPDRKCLSMLGALAFGGDWLNDVPDSEYTHPAWRELLAYVDVLATHPYANFSPGGPGPTSADLEGDGLWHLFRDFRPEGWRDSRQPGHKHDIGGILAQVPGKPLFISETGTFVHGDSWRNAETEQALRTLYSLAQQSGRVLGVSPFIWNSGPEHAGNRIWPNEDLRARLEGMPGYVTTAAVPVRGEQEEPVADRLKDMLASEFGSTFDDIRSRLAQRPNGPNGPFGPLRPQDVQGIVAHHSAGSQSTTWETVANSHVYDRQFAGIGYHVGLRQGRVAYLGSIETARAHVGGLNHRYVGVCTAGNYETTQPDPRDVANMKQLVGVFDRYFGRAVPWVVHGDLAQTLCCGKNLKPYVRTLRSADPPTDRLAVALGKWADVAQSIQPNPTGALYKQITADGFYVLSDESGARGIVPEVEGYPNILAQLARKIGGSSERVYYVVKPDWGNVQWVAR